MSPTMRVKPPGLKSVRCSIRCGAIRVSKPSCKKWLVPKRSNERGSENVLRRAEAAKRLQSRGNGKIDIVRVAIGDMRIRFACRLFHIAEIFSTDRPNKLAIDKVLNLE